jgi:hypothetical protein
MTDKPTEDIGDAAIVAFIKAYAEATVDNTSTTFDYPAVKAGLKAVIDPLTKAQGSLAMELGAWVGVIQNTGYESQAANPNAVKRFNTALTTLLQATFEVGQSELQLSVALSPPAVVAPPK